MNHYVTPAGRDRGFFGKGDGRGHNAATRSRVMACPNEHLHAYGPSGYIQWHHWAAEKAKTHHQELCECGLYLLLVEGAA